MMKETNQSNKPNPAKVRNILVAQIIMSHDMEHFHWVCRKVRFIRALSNLFQLSMSHWRSMQLESAQREQPFRFVHISQFQADFFPFPIGQSTIKLHNGFSPSHHLRALCATLQEEIYLLYLCLSNVFVFPVGLKIMLPSCCLFQ